MKCGGKYIRMLPSSISRCVAGGGPNGVSLGSWLKSVTSKWFSSAKPIIIGAKPSTVPLTSSIAQCQSQGVVARWNFADRWNQSANRSRLINLYTRQFRSYIVPSPRARLRGFGTLFGFVALAPAMRNVDSKDESDSASYEDKPEYFESLVSQCAKRNVVSGCEHFEQRQDANVQKLGDLHILRRATSSDGDAWVLRGALSAFMAKRNRVVDAIRIEEVPDVSTSEYQTEPFDEHQALSTSTQLEEMGTTVYLDSASASDEYSVIEEDSAAEYANLCDTVLNVCEGTHIEKSLYSELLDDDSRDYSVISDEEVPFGHDSALISVRTDLPHVSADASQPAFCQPIDLQHSLGDLHDLGSVGETVFECSHHCDTTHSHARLEMRSNITTDAAICNVAEWLNGSPSASSASTESSCDSTLLRNLHDTAAYFVYTFADRCSIPSELMHPACKLHYQSAWHLVLPRFSVLHVPVCSVLGDQLVVAHARRFGAVRFESTPTGVSIRAAARTRLENAAGIIRSLCTLATLQRGNVSEESRPVDSKEFYLVVRQRPVPFRSFLRQLELEILESRALSNSHNGHAEHSCVRWFDSVVLQLLEFGWTALMADRLRFMSSDFEQLIDALGVEVDVNTPRVVLLGDVDSFDAMFSPTRVYARSTTRELSARESFAAFAFVVYLNISRLVDLELAGRLQPEEEEFSARHRLVCSMYAAREENVGHLREAMDNLREVTRLNKLNL